MKQAPPPVVSLWLLSVIATVFWACLAAWAVVVSRWRRGLAVLPYQPRRPVPWRGLDLLIVLLLNLAAMAVLMGLAEPLLGPEVTREPTMYNVEKANAAHTIARLLSEGNPWALVLCGLSAVVVAPIVEEFLFRVLLQGWLEAAQRRLRPKMPTLRRLVPGALGPILLTAFLFGIMHFRVDRPMRHPTYELFQVAGVIVASLMTGALALGLVRWRAGATAVDLGWVREKFFADVRLGVVAFAALAAPIYAAMYTLSRTLPKGVAPDPIVLFFFALALGTLYYRTHRIVPVIVLHMSLNLTSLAMAWLSLAK